MCLMSYVEEFLHLVRVGLVTSRWQAAIIVKPAPTDVPWYV